MVDSLNNYETEFQLILFAGNARSQAMSAIEEAREGNIEQSKKMLQDAKQTFKKAHQYQTEMIKAEASGDNVHVNILLVHAQDHLTMALTTMDNAEEFIFLYEILYKNNLIHKKE